MCRALCQALDVAGKPTALDLWWGRQVGVCRQVFLRATEETRRGEAPGSGSPGEAGAERAVVSAQRRDSGWPEPSSPAVHTRQLPGPDGTGLLQGSRP